MIFNNQVFARFSFNVFAVQTSRYIGLHKPKPRSTFSGYFHLSSCSLILYMHGLSIVHIAFLFVQAQQQYMYISTCTLFKPNEMIAKYFSCHFGDVSLRYNCKERFSMNSLFASNITYSFQIFALTLFLVIHTEFA